MKLKIRILSTLLAVLMMMGTLSILGSILASAANDDEKTIASKYLKENIFNTPEEKLASMTLMRREYGYELYVDDVSAEVAVRETATGNILFSNPYDVASARGSNMFAGGKTGTKEKNLMSQIVVQFMNNGNREYLYSFADAAMKGQISVSKIKSGVRIEYAIGQETIRQLLPRWIPKESFEELIKAPLDVARSKGQISNLNYDKFMNMYRIKDPNDPTLTSGEIAEMQRLYPYTAEETGGKFNVIYVYAANASDVENAKYEEIIKANCSDTYSFEQMDIDHTTTGYVAENEEFPLFKMALEYSLNENGLSVSLPCNGLQYNAASYTLENISILPYMGAGNVKNDGYNFYPDGAGSLFDYKQEKYTVIRGSIYGTDYAYHDISGKYEKAIRVPVYGAVSTEVIYTYGYNKVSSNGAVLESHPEIKVSNTVKSREEIEEFLSGSDIVVTTPLTENSYKRGYLAVIESGESLGKIESYYSPESDYAAMKNYFTPKPYDSYKLSDSISVSNNDTWTVVSNRKYTGNITIQYFLLSDEKIGEATKAQNPGFRYYDASWLGMAEAYRDYLLYDKKVLQPLTEEEVKPNNIPLYMEVFGALETQQTIATIPVQVMTPLTTFENVLTMYQELAALGVKNINFKMTGFANGGMYSGIPSALKWEKKVGGKSGFKDLVEAANKVNSEDASAHLGLYPDFDFAYSSKDTLFDALNLKKDAIKTIDNRYTSKRQYSATQQKYISFYQLAISPSRYSKFYEKLMKNYEQYGLLSMSVSSLGTTLNTDFDEDEPYNREDNKEYTVQAYQDLKAANYSLMTDGGNAYSWSYVDHIVNMDLDSSRYVKSSASVPFLGAVLHGYIQFAGTPLNEEGNINYSMLKAIENGAGMYFVLSYQNTQELKEDEELSQYYSIRYDIWKNDVVTHYNTLNDLLCDVQTKHIINHQFLNYNNTDANGNKFLTERVLDIDEVEDRNDDLFDDAKQDAEEAERNEAINQIAQVAEARMAILKANKTMTDELNTASAMFTTFKAQYERVNTILGRMASEDFINQQLSSQFRSDAVRLWKNYTEYLYQMSRIDLELEKLADLLKIVREAKEGTSAEYQYTEAKAVYDAVVEMVEAGKAEVEASLISLLGTAEFASAYANIIAQAKAYVDAYNALPESAEKPIVVDLNASKMMQEGEFVAPEEDTDKDSDDTKDDEDTRYQVNNNKVVAVTYGDFDRESGTKTAYKIFILNYNNYAVRVTYNGVVYTVQAGGYVVLMAQAND